MIHLDDASIDYFLDVIEELSGQIDLSQLETFIQHRGTSCYWHSLAVSYLSFALASSGNMDIDYRSLIRGAMLHDYFLYDWRDRKSGFTHGYTHPLEAYHRVSEFVELNSIEKDIITKHMFPLTIVPPKTREAFIVVLVDKYCCLSEVMIKDCYHRIFQRLEASASAA